MTQATRQKLLIRLPFLYKRSSLSYSSSSSPSESRSRHFPAVTGPAPMLPAGSLDGRVALVTGGGTGLGRGLASSLSRLGASVVISARKSGPLESTARDISSATGRPVIALPCDVRDPAAIESTLDACEKQLGGPPSLVVNNAAGNFVSPTERLSPNAFRTVVDIVLLGTANVTMATAKRLIKAQQRGSFLSVTTVYAETGSPFVVPSACAKAGVEAMTKSLAAEWGRYGLRFNCIAPGPIETKGAFSRLDPTGEFIAHAVKRIPAGRLGEINEFANLAVYLLSDYASWINGSIIKFDGGETCAIGGEFSPLLRITQEQWDAMEKMIRAVKGS